MWTSVRLTILSQSKKTNVKATLQNTQRDVKLLQTLLGTRNELRKVEEIPAVELNEYICEFIVSVRTKDYEPCLLRSLLASFERHLQEGGIGIFGFAVLGIFLIGFSVFVSKDFGFSVLVFNAVCGFFVF